MVIDNVGAPPVFIWRSRPRLYLSRPLNPATTCLLSCLILRASYRSYRFSVKPRATLDCPGRVFRLCDRRIIFAFASAARSGRRRTRRARKSMRTLRLEGIRMTRAGVAEAFTRLGRIEPVISASLIFARFERRIGEWRP